MHSAFNLLAFHNSMFTPFSSSLGARAMCSGEIALKSNHYYYYYSCITEAWFV